MILERFQQKELYANMQNCLNRYKTNLKYFFAISDVIIHLIYIAYTSTLL